MIVKRVRALHKTVYLVSKIDPASVKVQPEHFQGQLIEIQFKCPSKQKLYLKIQGKSVNLGRLK